MACSMAKAVKAPRRDLPGPGKRQCPGEIRRWLLLCESEALDCKVSGLQGLRRGDLEARALHPYLAEARASPLRG